MQKRRLSLVKNSRNALDKEASKAISRVTRRLERKGLIVLAQELGDTANPKQLAPPKRESGSFWKRLKVVPNPDPVKAAKSPVCISTQGGMLLHCTNQQTAIKLVNNLKKVPDIKVLGIILIIAVGLALSRGIIFKAGLWVLIAHSIRNIPGGRAELSNLVKELKHPIKFWKEHRVKGIDYPKPKK